MKTRSSSTHRAVPLSGTAVIAFDRETGRVHATYVHTSMDGQDAAGLKRNRERLLAEVAKRLGCKTAALDAIEVPQEKLPEAGIERVDPVKQKLVPAKHADKRAAAVLRRSL